MYLHLHEGLETAWRRFRLTGGIFHVGHTTQTGHCRAFAVHTVDHAQAQPDVHLAPSGSSAQNEIWCFDGLLQCAPIPRTFTSLNAIAAWRATKLYKLMSALHRCAHRACVHTAAMGAAINVSFCLSACTAGRGIGIHTGNALSGRARNRSVLRFKSRKSFFVSFGLWQGPKDPPGLQCPALVGLICPYLTPHVTAED